MSLGGRSLNKGATKSGGHQSQGKQTNKNAEKSQRGGKAAADADGDEVGIRKNVLALMETTCRTEEEVCSALHDCDNDIEKACDMLLEDADQTQGWQTNEKKKKKSVNNVPTNAVGAGTELEDWSIGGDKGSGGIQTGVVGSAPHPNVREHRTPSRGRSGGKAYRGRGDGGHMNNEDGDGMSRGGGARRGPMGRGGGRGGGRGSSRGGRGSRPPRGGHPRHPQHSEDTWAIGNVNEGQDGYGDQFPLAEDWENEEWTGSLADTKVFTPSATSIEPVTINSDMTMSPQNNMPDQNVILGNMPSLLQQQESNNDYSKQSVAGMGVETSSTPPPSIPSLLPQDPAIYAYTNSTHHLPKSQSPVAMNVSGTLSAAQSQYFSQLTQKSESMKQQSMLNTQVYNTNYGVYGSEISQRKPVVRARVPPPSKIPATPVEMPGDLGSSSIGMLDVQFGALDFCSDTSPFLNDGVSSSVSNSINSNDKYMAASGSLDHGLSDSGNATVSSQQSASLEIHQSTPSSMSNDVSAYSSSVPRSTQMLTSDSMSTSASEQNATGSSSQYGSGVSRTSTSAASSHAQLTTVAGLESQLTGKSSGASVISSQQSYSSYPGQSAGYEVQQAPKQQYHTHHGYPANPYSQVNSSGTAFTAASSIASASAYPPTNTLNQYQHVSQPLNTYQNSSVYGGSGLYTAGSGVSYNSYQALQSNSNKITSNTKDSQYDTAVSTANLSISQPTQSTQASSKISSSSGKTNSSSSTSVMNSGSTASGGHVNTLPMGQYIMGQHYYTQQPLPYGYEDVQVMQPRLPHHMPGYYEVNFSAGGGGAGASARDAPLGSFAGSLAAGTADTRFGRTEAPSPQAVAGGGAGAAQPPQTAMAPYYYTYGGSMLPAGSFQHHYSTQPIYPIATAGGTGSSSYGAGKGVGGGGAYVGSAGGVVGAYGAPTAAAAPPPQPYETVQQQQPTQINSHQQEYKSGGGYSTQQSSGVKQGVTNSNSGTADLNNAIYGGKGHVSLGKVNSYDKAYHSATPPPPFGLGAAAGGVAGVGAGGYAPPLYLPHAAIPPPPQQHQMDGRVNNNHRRDNGTNNARGGTTGQSKQGGGAKQGYGQSYWTPN